MTARQRHDDLARYTSGPGMHDMATSLTRGHEINDVVTGCDEII